MAWEKDLPEYIESCRYTPFEWGVNDCCEFVRGSIIATTGNDAFEDLTYNHRSRKRAFLYLRGLGFNNPWELFDSRFTAIPPLSAKRGDLIGHISGDGESMGVCLGANFCAPGADGLEFIPMQNAIKAWRVERG